MFLIKLWQVLVFLIAFLSPKQSKNEGELCIVYGKANGRSFTWIIQALELFSPFPKANQECKEEKQREESNMKKSKRTAFLGHISRTLWSPLGAHEVIDTLKEDNPFHDKI